MEIAIDNNGRRWRDAATVLVAVVLAKTHLAAGTANAVVAAADGAATRRVVVIISKTAVTSLIDLMLLILIARQ